MEVQTETKEPRADNGCIEDDSEAVDEYKGCEAEIVVVAVRQTTGALCIERRRWRGMRAQMEGGLVSISGPVVQY